jgi:hypothetical protein
MQKSFNGILLIPFFVLSITLNAQVTAVSPYSKIGVGDLNSNVYTRTLGFGGASLGVKDKLNINFSNPASYTALSLTTFHIGFQASSIEQEQADPAILEENSSAGLRYFAFGLPLTEWWGGAFGIQPYSFKGYSISSQTSFGGVDVTNESEGVGGLNQFFFGNAFKVAEGLSLGFNTSFIFGKIEENTYVLWDNANFVNTKIQEVANVTGFIFNYGAQYTHDLGNDKELGFGLTYSNTMDLNADVGDFAYTFLGQPGLEFPIDSTATSSSSDSKITLPSEFGFGISYGKKNPVILNYAWMLSADFQLYNGSEFRDYNGENVNMVNGYKAEAGAYVTPRYSFKGLARNSSYWSAIEYRVGGFYEETPFSIAGTQISNYGITFGLGLPVKPRGLGPGETRISTINTGLVIGRRGTTDNGLVQENYLNFYLGLTLNDKWFIKYKYR